MALEWGKKKEREEDEWAYMPSLREMDDWRLILNQEGIGLNEITKVKLRLYFVN